MALGKRKDSNGYEVVVALESDEKDGKSSATEYATVGFAGSYVRALCYRHTRMALHTDWNPLHRRWYYLLQKLAELTNYAYTVPRVSRHRSWETSSMAEQRHANCSIRSYTSRRSHGRCSSTRTRCRSHTRSSRSK
mgnify:FL=1